MIKKSYLLFLSFTLMPILGAVPNLDRYGGHYDVQINTAPYNFHYRFYAEPSVNDFEYRSILDDVYTIWSATNTISECDQWRIINILLETRIDPYLTYPPGFFRSSIPFDSTSLVYFSTSVAVALGFISTNTINSTVFYSTIPICREGKGFNER